jgi:hypothetical protein
MTFVGLVFYPFILITVGNVNWISIFCWPKFFLSAVGLYAAPDAPVCCAAVDTLHCCWTVDTLFGVMLSTHYSDCFC